MCDTRDGSPEQIPPPPTTDEPEAWPERSSCSLCPRTAMVAALVLGRPKQTVGEARELAARYVQAPVLASLLQRAVNELARFVLGGELCAEDVRDLIREIHVVLDDYRATLAGSAVARVARPVSPATPVYQDADGVLWRLSKALVGAAIGNGNVLLESISDDPPRQQETRGVRRVDGVILVRGMRLAGHVRDGVVTLYGPESGR